MLAGVAHPSAPWDRWLLYLVNDSTPEAVGEIVAVLDALAAEDGKRAA